MINNKFNQNNFNQKIFLITKKCWSKKNLFNKNLINKTLILLFFLRTKYILWTKIFDHKKLNICDKKNWSKILVNKYFWSKKNLIKKIFLLKKKLIFFWYFSDQIFSWSNLFWFNQNLIKKIFMIKTNLIKKLSNYIYFKLFWSLLEQSYKCFRAS